MSWVAPASRSSDASRGRVAVESRTAWRSPPAPGSPGSDLPVHTTGVRRRPAAAPAAAPTAAPAPLRAPAPLSAGILAVRSSRAPRTTVGRALWLGASCTRKLAWLTMTCAGSQGTLTMLSAG
ncbi:hypothetical protein GCM10018987_27810 [Streptomyces cremeus]